MIPVLFLPRHKPAAPEPAAVEAVPETAGEPIAA